MKTKFGPLKSINKTNLSQQSQSPGVYGIHDVNSRLLRIGRAKKGRIDERIMENKAEVSGAKKYGFISTSTVQEAIKLETQLLKKRKPPYNKEVKGK